MIQSLIALCVMLLLTGCSALESIPYSPSTTPGEWLAMQPTVEIEIGSGSILVVQPSTSAIVYLLGVISILAGLYFFRIRGQRSPASGGNCPAAVGCRSTVCGQQLRGLQLSAQMRWTRALHLDAWVGDYISGRLSGQRGCDDDR